MPRWFASGWGRFYPLRRSVAFAFAGALSGALGRAQSTATQTVSGQIDPIGNFHSSESYAFSCEIAGGDPLTVTLRHLREL
jgi:hypothetical protein